LTHRLDLGVLSYACEWNTPWACEWNTPWACEWNTPWACEWNTPWLPRAVLAPL